MRIAYFFRQLNQGGIQRMIVTSANYFVEAGHEVTVIVIKPGGEYHELLDPRVKTIAFASPRASKLQATLSSILKKQRFDVLFTATPELNTLTILARALARSKTRIVISERNNTLVFFRNMKFTLSKLTFLSIPVLYRFADAIVAVSEGVAMGLRKFALLPADRIRVIHNPAYSPDAGAALTPAEHEWFGDPGVPVVVTVGRLTPAKNQVMLVEAMALLLKSRPARLLIVGEGPERPAIEARIAALGIGHAVQLAGFQLNPVSWMSQATVFALSSNYEGFGNVLVEAIGAGATVVSTDCDYGPSEILGDRWGYLVPVGDAAAMAERIAFALDTPIPAGDLAARANDFGVDHIMGEYADLFSRLTRT